MGNLADPPALPIRPDEQARLAEGADPGSRLVYTIDRSFHITSVNTAWDAFARANGAPQLVSSRVIGTSLLAWIAGPWRDEARDVCGAIFAGDLPSYEREFDCSAPDRRRVFSLVISPLLAHDSTIVGATLTSYDITRQIILEEEVTARTAELRKAMDDLRVEHAGAEGMARQAMADAARLAATIGAMNDAVVMCDQGGQVITANEAALALFGLRHDAVVGHSLAHALRHYPARLDAVAHGLGAALEGESRQIEGSAALHADNHTCMLDIRTAPVRDEGGTIIGAVAVVRDITEARAMARLKDDFLAIAAHELKTPVAALKGYAQLTVKRFAHVPEFAPVRRYMTTIDQQADRITGLVRKLLDVSRIHTGTLDLHLGRFDLVALVHAVADQLALIAPDNPVEIEPHPPVWITADAERIEQVIYNLFENASKYSRGGGAIRVDIAAARDCVTVTVHDNGVGIPPEKLALIFDRWYQAHNGDEGDFGGMGLGLYICREIVERHGGVMHAEARPSGGASVGFTLPVQEAHF